MMNIQECYRLLEISSKASRDEITTAYKKLALQYHPDKNRGKEAWATRIMADINRAYASILSFKFSTDENEVQKDHSSEPTSDAKHKENTRKETEESEQKQHNKKSRESLIDEFVDIRETCKDSLYRYFQYSLYNLTVRDKYENRAIYERIVKTLRLAYHSIEHLLKETTDAELHEHFGVFKKLIFNFYRSSECINILDSYIDSNEVAAFRMYRNADEQIHQAQKEIFYNRHNRGSVNLEFAYTSLIRGLKELRSTLKIYQNSSWAVESRIKMDYAMTLKDYIELFFSD